MFVVGNFETLIDESGSQLFSITVEDLCGERRPDAKMCSEPLLQSLLGSRCASHVPNNLPFPDDIHALLYWGVNATSFLWEVLPGNGKEFMKSLRILQGRTILDLFPRLARRVFIEVSIIRALFDQHQQQSIGSRPNNAASSISRRAEYKSANNRIENLPYDASGISSQRFSTRPRGRRPV